MGFFDYLITALGTIASQRGRSALTTLGVIIGVASVVLLISLGESAGRYISNEFSGLGSNILQVSPGKRETKGFGPPPSGTNNDPISLRDAEELKRRGTTFSLVAPFIQGGGTLRYEGRERNTFVIGSNEDYMTMRQFEIDQGRDFSKEDVDLHRRVVIIGRTLQRELFGNENPLGQKLKISDTEFRIVGLTKPRGNFAGLDMDDIAFIPVTGAMDLFNLDSINAVLVQSRNASQMPLAREQIADILTNLHGEEDFTVISPDDVLKVFNSIIGMITLLLSGIASISLVVGGIGIMNIMLVSVTERTREIGVRRALGATKREILLQFLLESIAVSMLGGTIGLLLGGGVALAIRAAVPDLPIEISPVTALVAFGFSAAVGMLSGAFPAWRAARLDPVEALRYE
jgi:putative ABC transport system permease protein